ncbi:MAG: cytochrome c biogenesis protein CcdA [Anaerolineales bacterium]|nr:cytochrome c biogenesis protein CcdA [Anaerolineales bacterium]
MSDLKLPKPLQALSTTQMVLVGLGIVLVAFLILGSLGQANADPNGFAFGIQTQPFIILAVLSFLAGILSFVSPCTLPVLTAYFAFAFQSDRSKIASNTLAFMIGLATTFSLFGAAGFFLGRYLLQNQQVILLVGGAVIILFGVLSLLGGGFGGTAKFSDQTRSTDMRGSFLFGLTFAVGWSSCVGPILGSVLTLAAQTSSVWRGMMLLFIYTLGLGLPLLLVSTFFGRMSRKSLFWRILRGKGWEWHTHMLVVAAVWALAIWRNVVAVVEYAFRRFAVFDGQTFGVGHEIGLLVLVLAGAALWVYTSPQERQTTVQLHSTQLISGALFIVIGMLMLNGQLAAFNNLIPPQLAEWLAIQEEWLIGLFS